MSGIARALAEDAAAAVADFAVAHGAKRLSKECLVERR